MYDEDDEMEKHQRRVAGLINEPKLTWDQVNDIRRTYVLQSRTYGLKSLAAQYGVSANNIHKIVRGKTWRVSEGDGNIPAPLAGRVTTQKFWKAFGKYHLRLERLRPKLDRLSIF